MSAPYLNTEGYPDPTAKKALDRVAKAERSARPNRMTVDEWLMTKAPKQPKYRNKKTDGFDSEKEKTRYNDLLLLQRAGKISGLERQVSFELIPEQFDEVGRLLEHAAHYVADFTYVENGASVVEDVKSPITRKNPVYILKRKLMLLKYGVRIREV